MLNGNALSKVSIVLVIELISLIKLIPIVAILERLKISEKHRIISLPNSWAHLKSMGTWGGGISRAGLIRPDSTRS